MRHGFGKGPVGVGSKSQRLAGVQNREYSPEYSLDLKEEWVHDWEKM